MYIAHLGSSQYMQAASRNWWVHLEIQVKLAICNRLAKWDGLIINLLEENEIKVRLMNH